MNMKAAGRILVVLAATLLSGCVRLPEQLRREFDCGSVGLPNHFGDQTCARE